MSGRIQVRCETRLNDYSTVLGRGTCRNEACIDSRSLGDRGHDLATIANIQAFGVLTMSAHHDTHEPSDPVEAVVKHIPIIIPAAGAVLIFLLAFIAVFMA